ASRDTDIRFFRFSRTIHHASHDSHFDIQRNVRHHLFHLVRQTDQIDPGPAAGGTGYNLNAAFSQSQRLEDQLCRPDLLHRIAGERHPDRVADPFIEDDSKSYGRLDVSRVDSSRFRDAYVERIRALLCDQLVSSDAHHDI